MSTLIGMCCHNNLELTKKACDSIDLNTRDQSYKLVFVDDASTDGTADYLKERYPQAAVLVNSINEGYTKSANKILRARSGFDGVVLINNDVEVNPGWLTKLINNGGDIVGCKVMTPEGQLIHESVRVSGRKTIHGNFLHCDYINGCCMYVKSSLMDVIGEFDEIFAPAYHEETDLCLRARLEGYNVAYEPTCEVYHAVCSSYGTKPDTKQVYDRSWGILKARWSID